MKDVTAFKITTRATMKDGAPERFFHSWRMTFADESQIWFCFLGDELRAALDGETTCVTDLSHVCKIDLGSLWTFFDVPCPAQGAGEFTTRYHRVELTHELRAELRAAIEQNERQWLRQPERDYGGRDDVELDVSYRLPEWRTWHQGAGKAEFDCGDDPLTADKLAFWLEDESFARCADRLLAIARNQTYKPSDVGVCKLRWNENWQEFSFFVGGLHGGIINHGKGKDKADWSTHT